jgi:uncharacterized protein
MPRPSHATYVPTALDVAAFCRDGGHVQGRLSLEEMPRLAESLLRPADGAGDGGVEWRAAGSLLPVSGGAPQRIVDLAVRATATLECQRCLQPMTLPLQVERRFRFVEGEDEAARLDEELEDDVLALTRRLDLLALVEDELLLALPLVPRHEDCPELPTPLIREPGAPVDSETQEPRSEHPFAALAALKRPKT